MELLAFKLIVSLIVFVCMFTPIVIVSLIERKERNGKIKAKN